MVSDSRLKELAGIADEIEGELSTSGNNTVGALSVKIQSLDNMLRREGEGDPRIRQLHVRARYFQTQIRILGERCAGERNKIEREMEDAKIKVKRISEAYDPEQELKEREFYSKQSGRIEDFISSTMDSLDSLKRQGVLIQRANERLRTGLLRLGVSASLLNKIETRFGRDKTFFMILFGCFVIFILLLRFYFK